MPYRKFGSLLYGIAITSSQITAPALSQPIPNTAERVSASTSAPVLHLAASTTWIDFDGSKNLQINIPVKLNNLPVRAIVDTGAAHSLLSQTWASQHGMKLQHLGMAPSLNGTTFPVSITHFESLDFGAVSQNNGTIRVADIGNISNMAGVAPFDLVLGMDFMLGSAVDIDFDTQKIRFVKSGSIKRTGVRVPIRLSDGAPRIATSLTVGQARYDPVLIDTGKNGFVTLFGADTTKIEKLTDIAQVVAGGVLVSGLARLQGVKIGEAPLPGQIPVAFDKMNYVTTHPGLLGLGALSRFNVLIDTPQRVMILSPRQQVPPPSRVTNTGIQGVMTPQGWLVAHIMKHSPAEAAGLREGDRICTVNGETMTATSPIPQGEVGARMQLGLCDGRSLTLTRASFY